MKPAKLAEMTQIESSGKHIVLDSNYKTTCYFYLYNSCLFCCPIQLMDECLRKEGNPKKKA